MATFSKMDLGTLPHLKWSSLQQLVMVGLITNAWLYLHAAVVTQPSLQAKLKLDENGHALKAVSHTISCFVDMFLCFFSKTPITFCFTKVLFQFEN